MHCIDASLNHGNAVTHHVGREAEGHHLRAQQREPLVEEAVKVDVNALSARDVNQHILTMPAGGSMMKQQMQIDVERREQMDSTKCILHSTASCTEVHCRIS